MGKCVNAAVYQLNNYYVCRHHQICPQDDIRKFRMSLGPIFITILAPIQLLEIAGTLIFPNLSDIKFNGENQPIQAVRLQMKSLVVKV